jgi:hypothetical protein
MWYRTASPRLSPDEYKEVRIRLTVDLSKYNPAARIGAEGMWMRDGQSKQPFQVRLLENDHVMDVYERSLEIVDGPYLTARKHEGERQKDEALRSEMSTLYTGRNGGVKRLLYRDRDGRDVVITDRDRIKEIRDYVESRGNKINVIVERN